MPDSSPARGRLPLGAGKKILDKLEPLTYKEVSFGYSIQKNLDVEGGFPWITD
jgi:hypothetical protein